MHVWNMIAFLRYDKMISRPRLSTVGNNDEEVND